MSKRVAHYPTATIKSLHSLIFLPVILCLVSCGQVKPEATLPPIPTIISRTKDPSSLNANPTIGVGIDLDVVGYITRHDHGSGAVVEYQDSYLVSYVPLDKTYLFE